MAGISNVIIEEPIEEEDAGFYRNFVRAFLSDRATSFLNFLKIFWIQVEATCQVVIGAAYQTCNEKSNCFYLIAMVF